ncbi:BlaI/MecI/CopY family transcriptional regulator [Streptomyces avermitilis]
MPETQVPATELTSQYSAQVTGDLERNTKERERIGSEIEALQEQLRALQHNHTVLVSVQQALGGESAAAAEPAAKANGAAAPSVPAQASAQSKRNKPKKTVATSAKKTAAKKPTTKASSAKAPTTAAKPTLVDLIRGHLAEQSEPRSAAEITSALAQTHSDRGIKVTVVRNTLEGLVAKSHVHRTKQGASVFYTAATSAEQAAVDSPTEASAG